MENYIECKGITAHMKIFTKPMTKSMRYSIIKELDTEQKKAAEEKVFLPERAYPHNRGRPPKYDFLYVFVTDIDEASAEKVKRLLVEKTGRSVIYLPHSWRGEQGFAFLLPWRSPVDGKALPNKLKFFAEIRKEVVEAFGEVEISSYGKVQEKERKEESITEELIQEEVPAVDEQKRDDILKSIELLKRQKEKLEKDIASMERMSRYMPTYKSKKKRAKKVLDEVNAKIQMLRVELGRV